MIQSVVPVRGRREWARREFRRVPSPFGVGNDERATQEAFVEFVGGTERADRLLRIWKDSYPGIRVSTFKQPPGKEEVFRRKAKAESFKDEEIEAFLTL